VIAAQLADIRWTTDETGLPEAVIKIHRTIEYRLPVPRALLGAKGTVEQRQGALREALTKRITFDDQLIAGIDEMDSTLRADTSNAALIKEGKKLLRTNATLVREFRGDAARR